MWRYIRDKCEFRRVNQDGYNIISQTQVFNWKPRLHSTRGQKNKKIKTSLTHIPFKSIMKYKYKKHGVFVVKNNQLGLHIHLNMLGGGGTGENFRNHV